MRTRLLAALALVAVFGTGTLVASADAPGNTCDSVSSSSINTTPELKKYIDCRDDRIEKQLTRIENQTKPTPAPTSTVAPSGKPGPSNTGVPAGTKLTPYTGPKTITADGTVIDGKDVTGALVIKAKSVTIKNSKIHGSDEIGVDTADSGSLTIQDSEVYGFGTGLVYSNFAALRLNIHDITFDGAKLSSNAKIQDSWFHAPKPTADAHWDGIQVQNGVVNTVIQGNNIDLGTADVNSALFLCPDLGPDTNGPLTVTGNWLNGGNFTVAILDGNNGQYLIKDIRVTNNRFGSDSRYGRANVNVPITQSGNVVDSTGAPFTL